MPQEGEPKMIRFMINLLVLALMAAVLAVTTLAGLN